MVNGMVTRVDGGERVPVGDPAQIQDRQIMRSIKQNAGSQAIQPEALMAIRDQALSGGGVTASGGVIQGEEDVRAIPAATVAPPAAPVAPKAPRAPTVQTERVSGPASAAEAGQDRISQIMERAKQRLATAKADEGKAERYKPDPDPGRQDEESKRNKDKYFPDYQKGRDAIKKLKANLSLKLNKVSGLIRGSVGTKAFTRLKELRREIMAELALVAGVAEDLRMKDVSYSPEKDVGRQEDDKRSKDKYVGPDKNPINNELSKMWSSSVHMPKLAKGIFDPEGDEGKDPKEGKEKNMGGNDMKPPEKDSGERKDIPKGKEEKGKGSGDQIKNLQNAVKELEKKDLKEKDLGEKDLNFQKRKLQLRLW